MATLSGFIVIVQEDRFLLEVDSGGHRLFVLSHSGKLNSQDLRAVMRSRRHVSVSFNEPDHLITAVAEQIAPVELDGAHRMPRTGIRRTLAGFLADWSLPRQLVGQSGRSKAAESRESRAR